MLIVLSTIPVMVTGALIGNYGDKPFMLTWQLLLLGIFGIVLAIAIGTFFALGITRPISKCVTGALAIARGNFGYSLDIKSRNEIGELAHTFNYMSRQLLYYDNKNKELLASIERAYLETIRALANSIDAKDPYTRGHSMRVTEYAQMLGKDLGLEENELNLLSFGSTLHDIGKIGIREEILTKKTQLTDSERKLMQQHPVLGEKIIEPVDFLQPVRPLIRHHHEWVDGSGYPDGLKGDQIPLGARIIATVDTYDAVTSKRPYQEAVTKHQAIEILNKLRDTQLDPIVCDAMVRIVKTRLPPPSVEKVSPDKPSFLLDNGTEESNSVPKTREVV